MQRTDLPLRSYPLVLVAVLLAACGSTYDPPSLIVPDKLRVLGVRADPPAITMAQASTLTMLNAGEAKDADLCYAWAFCPYTWSKDGAYTCIDDELLVTLGTAATTTVSIADVFSSLSHAEDVFKKLGLQMPTGGTTDTTDTCKSASGGNPFTSGNLPDAYILFQVAQKDLYNGTCPDIRAALSTPCPDRQKCIQGFKRLGISPAPPAACTPFDASKDKDCSKTDPCDTKQVCGCDGRTYDSECDRVAAKVSKASDGACPDQNPSISGVGLFWPLVNGKLENIGTLDDATKTYKPDPKYTGLINWPEDVTPVMHPGDSIELVPQWPGSAKEYVGKSTDPSAPPVYETLLFSWFTTGGSWAQDRSYDAYPENVFTAPGLEADGKPLTVTLWIVVRDGRNGTAWIKRQVTVTPAAGDPKDQLHPLCRTNPVPGCPKS